MAIKENIGVKETFYIKEIEINQFNSLLEINSILLINWFKLNCEIIIQLLLSGDASSILETDVGDETMLVTFWIRSVVIAMLLTSWWPKFGDFSYHHQGPLIIGHSCLQFFEQLNGRFFNFHKLSNIWKFECSDVR